MALTNQYFGRTPVDLTDIMTNTNTFYNKVPQTHTGAGGHYNHCFFWQCMGPVAEASKTRPSPALQKAIDKQFGSTDGMKAEFKQAALDRFGAGWAVRSPCCRRPVAAAVAVAVVAVVAVVADAGCRPPPPLRTPSPLPPGSGWPSTTTPSPARASCW